MAQKKAKERKAKDKARTFADVWIKYLPDAMMNKKPTSCQREKSLFNRWIRPVIGSTPLVEIRPFQLERLKKNMRDKNRAPATIRYALAVVRQVFNFAKRNDMFEGDPPTSKVKFPQADNRRLRFLTPGEAQSLLTALAEKDINVHDMALISLDCGLRRGEIFGLTWTDVDCAKGLLTLRNTKNGRSRAAFMTSRVRERLLRRAAASDNDMVFPGSHNGRAMALSRAFGPAVTALGLNDGINDPRQRIVFHSLRHTFASRLAESGVSLYTIKEVLGHSTITMTERYAHLSEKTLRQTSEVLEAYCQVENPTQVAFSGLISS